MSWLRSDPPLYSRGVTDLVQPLISTPVPLMVLKDEYKSGSTQVMKKLEWLESQGWDQVWRARGDGDCFYRCRSPLSRS